VVGCGETRGEAEEDEDEEGKREIPPQKSRGKSSG